MKFNKTTKLLLEKAGWFPGRKISMEELKLPYHDYPQFVVDFLKEYGNLYGVCLEQSYTAVINEFNLEPEMPHDKLIGDNDYPYYSNIIGRKLFPLGGHYPDGHHICCDHIGRVYVIGESLAYRGENLYMGVQNIILGDWQNSLQLDENTGKWWNRDAQYEELSQ